MLPASYCYGLGAYARLVAYATGLASRRQAPAPVISVGNLTVGGTGKTPFTIELAERLSSAGLKVGVLSRGYGRKIKDNSKNKHDGSNKHDGNNKHDSNNKTDRANSNRSLTRGGASPVVVADGTGAILVDVTESGDEPYLIAQAVPDAVVIVGASRLESARKAVVDYGAQVLLLDDGFQHIKLRRDIDIVLWDYNDAPDQALLLPAGRLREPLSSLNRATDIIVTKIPEPYDDRKLANLVAQLANLAPHANIASCRFKPAYLSDFAFEGRPSQPIKLSELVGKKIYALSSIARPESFIRVLKDLGVSPVAQKHFPDHHWFSPQDLAEVEKEFLGSGAELLITTEKDMVRLKGSLSQPVAERTWSLVLAAQWLSPMPEIVDRLARIS